ncbi:MAG: [protein-PII] uridylyltransferase [Gammaproteobacteria bacterium]
MQRAALTAPDFDDRSRLLPQTKEYLRQLSKALQAEFEQDTPITELVRGRAQAVDQLLAGCWHAFGLDEDASLALLAVGGYGRGELHPASDIDILILYPDESHPDEDRLSAFLTFLWDIGLDVGHSVRSLAVCIQEAEADVTVITNLIEKRLITGSQQTFQVLDAALAPERVWNSRDFFSAKLKEQQDRHEKFLASAYRVEPNLKESPGGLRDIQMIGWVCKRHFGTESLQELVEHEFLTQKEYDTLVEGQNFLWQVRFALHQICGRKEDRLLFEFQRQLAHHFGYTEDANNASIEAFMQRYYRTVMELERLNEMLLQHFYEEILLGGRKNIPVVALNRRFQSRGGYLEAINPQVFSHYPPSLLELFLVLQQHPELVGIRASTIRLIRAHLHLIDQRFRKDLICRSLFMEMFRHGEGLTATLRMMNRHGVLAAYLAPFSNVVGRMQFDLFHVYTVDEHILMVVRNLRRFAIPEFRHELPQCSSIFENLPKPELLYLAGLFHDVAKGRGGDHSELGAEDALQFCLDHGLSQYDAHLVAWLVRAHLIMSMTAQRRDISDPVVIHEFAQQVGSTTRLDYLYLLTVADIRGTNPDLWNDWKGRLLADLYQRTRRALREGLDQPLNANELIAEVQNEALALLRDREIDEETARRCWSVLDADYFLRHSADEVAWHVQVRLQADPAELPVVEIRRKTGRGSTEILIFTRDDPRLFALVTAVLAQAGLDILDARIFTTDDGYTLDTFLALDEDGEPITETHHIRHIRQALLEALHTPTALPVVQRMTPRVLKQFSVPCRVSFSNPEWLRYTVMDLTAADRPGLLAKVGKVMAELGLRVHKARIATVSEVADDVFFITDGQGRKVTGDTPQEEIRARLVEALGTADVPAQPPPAGLETK